jgi:hypothetical protein
MRRTLTVLAVLAIALFLTTTLPASAQIERQHYQCYDILSHDSRESRDVQLVDQFGDSRGLVGHPVRLCNPVDKNGEESPNRDVHLVCYAIRTEPGIQVRSVIISNQFGEDRLFVGERDTLCVPSKKQINE